MNARPDSPSPAVLAAPPLDLSDNTSLYGAPPAALRALRDADPDTLARYPSARADDLRAALAMRLGAHPDQITTGCGSDDVLDSAMRALAAPGERIAFADPTFSMVPDLARRNRLEAVPVPLTRGFDLDADGLLATGAGLIYLCSPNNPTGTLASPAALTRVLDRAPGVVVLDQAYAEFAASRPDPGLWKRPSCLVVRTLSKAFGLAGLRVGYGIGHPTLVARVEEARGPYKVGAAAERAAVAALSEDMGWVEKRVAEARHDRARLVAELSAIGITPLPSAANFVLVPVPDAAVAAGRMRRAGVLVRAFPRLTGIGDALRITVAPGAAVVAAVAALREALR